MMKEKSGWVFSLAEENAQVPGCTISGQSGEGIVHFSLAENTDISAESSSVLRLWLMDSGEAEAFNSEGETKEIRKGDLFAAPAELPVGIRTRTGCVYTEIAIEEDSKMNQVIKAGQVFALKDLIPYQDGKVVSMDLASNSKMKLALMSFAPGTGLAEHAAPGDALVFALDGEAVIGYEGKKFPIKAGENFKFDKQGKHSVAAEKNFKMALLLELD